MSDQSNIGKGFLKDKLGEYQENPPESVWDSISARLGGRNRRGLYVLVLATAASVALAITLGINFFGPDKVEKDRLGAGSQSQKEAIKTPEDSLPDEAMAQAESSSREEIQSQAAVFPEPEAPVPGDDIPKVRSRDRVSLKEKVSKAMHTVAVEAETPGESDQAKLAALEQEQEQEQEQVQERELEQKPEQEPEQVLKEENPARDTVPLLPLDPGDELPPDMVTGLESDKKKDPRWMLGAVMSPLYSFRDANGQAMAGGTEYESGLVSYAGGINVSYRGNSRLAFESGIHFNKMGIAIGAPGIQLFNRSYEYGPMMDAVNSPELIAITNSIGNIVTISGNVIVNGYKLNAEFGEEAISNANVGDFAQVAEQGIEQHLDYLEVPFNLRYTVVDRSFELQVVGGLSTNFLVNNTVTMETASGVTEIGYLTNIRNVNYSGNAGIGMIYHIHKRFSFLLEPRFRYFLNSVNDASLPATRPYALGIYTGINFTF